MRVATFKVKAAGKGPFFLLTYLRISKEPLLTDDRNLGRHVLMLIVCIPRHK